VIHKVSVKAGGGDDKRELMCILQFKNFDVSKEWSFPTGDKTMSDKVHDAPSLVQSCGHLGTCGPGFVYLIYMGVGVS
jgi:hypothetical protein